MLKNSNKSFGIIGAGMAGSALAAYLASKNKLGFIFTRSKEEIPHLIKLGIPLNLIIQDLEAMCKIPDCFIIAVNDSAISSVSENLADTYGVILQDKHVFHISGTKSALELASLIPLNCKTFAAHPFQTFHKYRDDLFDNLYWGIEIGNTDEEDISDIIAQFGGKCLFLTENLIADKSKYHLIAVAASNFLISSIEFSKLLFENAKLNDVKLVEKIILTSMQNALDHYKDNSSFPITGPLVRSDFETIQNHLKSLADNENLRESYIHFSLATLRLLRERNVISDMDFNNLLKLLS